MRLFRDGQHVMEQAVNAIARAQFFIGLRLKVNIGGIAVDRAFDDRRDELDDGALREDYLYRISIKAIIYNDDGKMLVVKEHGLHWGLPGGGMDFGETFDKALARELEEEVGYSGGFSYDVVDVANPMYLSNIDAYQVWIV